ncbi:alpha-galactosidase [Streptomyces sp. NPDC051207]|uniref:alpha-galactosidase n=1 Tax=Streptomyces sp. NPDC051207 TaxID=3154641 RepID=UPI00342A34E7
MSVSTSVHTLTAATTSLVVDIGSGVPRVLHWGARLDDDPAAEPFLASLGESRSGADGLLGQHRHPAVLPEQSAGWMGTPGLEGHRDGTAFSTRFVATGHETTGRPDQNQVLVSRAVDEAVQLALTTTIELSAEGVARLRAALTNTAQSGTYTVNALRLALPVPDEAQEILDFTGRHLRERTPQRHPFHAGTHLREGRRGRTGSDAAFLLAAGTAGFGFRRGEVWAVHTAWSGNHATFAELGLNGVRLLGGGEVLLPGEVTLEPGHTYTTPWLYAVHGNGLDEIAAAFHRQLRARAAHPTTPRPVVLNTWEAVYFEHDLDTLIELATLGVTVGVERFVLDDGWFLGRRDDRKGLGDWQVDPAVWPRGLHLLVEAVRNLGMQFGLWFEPEMVSGDSELARAHPEWILAPGDGRLPLTGRHQHVLNLTVPGAYEHVLESISAIITEYDIDYVKWDHNRDLVEPGDRLTGEPKAHAQTLAAYALMDELRRRHPGLEIESCSSGGGRVDLEVLQRTDRVWASDCIDPLERQRIQRWTGLLLPFELVGSHVGAPTSHTTGRTHSLAFRAATALFGHFGIEWDLRNASAEELDELGEWVALYKQERDLLHSGTAVHCDYPDDTYWAHGVVSRDRTRALFTFVALDTSAAAQQGRIRLPGLDPELAYRVEPVPLSDGAFVHTRSGRPSWWLDRPVVSGRTLEAIGLQGPTLYPEQALVFRLVADHPAHKRN